MLHGSGELPPSLSDRKGVPGEGRLPVPGIPWESSVVHQSMPVGDEMTTAISSPHPTESN